MFSYFCLAWNYFNYYNLIIFLRPINTARCTFTNSNFELLRDLRFNRGCMDRKTKYGGAMHFTSTVRLLNTIKQDAYKIK